jgi:hypothetical protein
MEPPFSSENLQQDTNRDREVSQKKEDLHRNSDKRVKDQYFANLQCNTH